MCQEDPHVTPMQAQGQDYTWQGWPCRKTDKEMMPARRTDNREGKHTHTHMIATTHTKSEAESCEVKKSCRSSFASSSTFVLKIRRTVFWKSFEKIAQNKTKIQHRCGSFVANPLALLVTPTDVCTCKALRRRKKKWLTIYHIDQSKILI